MNKKHKFMIIIQSNLKYNTKSVRSVINQGITK
jgi:hypothetical protein